MNLKNLSLSQLVDILGKEPFIFRRAMTIQPQSGEEIVMNEDGLDCDFRVEGSSAENALLVQGSDGKVGIGVADPDTQLEIFSTSTQQKWSYDADTYATLGVGSDGVTILSTADPATGAHLSLELQGNLNVVPEGSHVYFRSADNALFDFDVSDPTLKIMNDADVGDYFSLNVGDAGATTLTTIDNAGATGHLTLQPDGNLVLAPGTGNITASGAVAVAKGLTHKRAVYHSVAQTAAKTFTTDDSGTLVILASTAAQIQVFNLPTIASSADLGTYFDFVVAVIGNSGAAGSYTINTGGHASDLTASPTAGYDDFYLGSKLLIAEPTIAATADKLLVSPTNGDGTMILADNTSVAPLLTGTTFRATAIAISTTTASTDVWLLEGTLMTGQATGFVTTNLFTAP